MSLNFWKAYHYIVHIIYICLYVFKQHDYVSICHCIILLTELNNIIYVWLIHCSWFISQAYIISIVASCHLIPMMISVYDTFTFSSYTLFTDTVYSMALSAQGSPWGYFPKSYLTRQVSRSRLVCLRRVLYDENIDYNIKFSFDYRTWKVSGRLFTHVWHEDRQQGQMV